MLTTRVMALFLTIGGISVSVLIKITIIRENTDRHYNLRWRINKKLGIGYDPNTEF
jgi:hypothetical protein